VEIVAGIVVLLKPRYGAYLVAAWLAGIVTNLFSYPGWYDIAVRDFGLMLGALTLARLASVYDPPLRRPKEGLTMAAAMQHERDDVIAWRTEQLLRSGFPHRLAAQVALDGRYDLHRLIELVERGCSPELALRILAPLEGNKAA